MSLTSIYNEGSECQIFQTSSCVLEYHFFVVGLYFYLICNVRRYVPEVSIMHVYCAYCLDYHFVFFLGLVVYFTLISNTSWYVPDVSIMLVFCAHSLDLLFIIFW